MWGPGTFFWMGHMQFLVYPFRRRSGVVKVSGSPKIHMEKKKSSPRKWKGTSSSKFRLFWAIWSNKANLARIPLPAYLLGWAASAEVEINCRCLKEKNEVFFQKGGACSALFGLLKVLNGRLSKSMVNEKRRFTRWGPLPVTSWVITPP